MILNEEFCPDVVVVMVAFVVVVVITEGSPLTKGPLDLFHCSLFRNNVKSVLFTIICMLIKCGIILSSSMICFFLFNGYDKEENWITNNK